jgi:hypothetical protein
MTGKEMQILFQDIIEAATKHFPKKWVPESDIQFEYINEAQNKFFIERYLTGSFVERTNFLRTHRQELLNLIEVGTVGVTEISAYSKSLIVTWDNTKEFVSGSIDITASAMGTVNTVVELIPIEGDINRFLTNHTNKPVILQPVISLVGDSKAMVIYDDYTTLATSIPITLDLLNAPATISLSQNCELLDRFHEIIVRMAASQLLQDKFGIAASTKEDNKQ